MASGLADFAGYLQTDAYRDCDQLFITGGATEIACPAHVRRKFGDAESTDSAFSRAAVDRIRVLFVIMEEAKDLTDEGRAALLRASMLRLLQEFAARRTPAVTRALPKSPMHRA